jgi:O-methyltransferase
MVRMLRYFRRVTGAIFDPSQREDARFAALRLAARILMPAYRLGWPQLAWWTDARFNAYLARFNELDGLNSARRWMAVELARLIAEVPGDTAECGVFQGAGSYLIASAGAQHGQERTHHVFDSFEGLSTPARIDGEFWRKGSLACGLDLVQANLRMFTHISFHKGWIPDTFEGVSRSTFAFVHIDVDLYQPTRDSIDFFYERMNAGGIILCDDYGFTTCPGATKAMDEFLVDKPEKMIALPTGGGFLIKGVATASAPELR